MVTILFTTKFEKPFLSCVIGSIPYTIRITQL